MPLQVFGQLRMFKVTWVRHCSLLRWPPFPFYPLGPSKTVNTFILLFVPAAADAAGIFMALLIDTGVCKKERSTSKILL